MIDAWLAGDVPHGVFADWCEEHGLPFPRAVSVVGRERRNIREACSGGGRFVWYNSRSGSSYPTRAYHTRSSDTYGSLSESRAAQPESVSGSRSGVQIRSVSGSRASR